MYCAVFIIVHTHTHTHTQTHTQTDTHTHTHRDTLWEGAAKVNIQIHKYNSDMAESTVLAI